jgi:cytochrome c biogenesis protein CcmG/thiol:disulfide interchange protein DsbE
MKLKYVIALCLGVLSFSRAHAAPLPAGHPAPSFVLKDAGGKSISLTAYKGKVVLLNFWATWCAPCRIEMPWFEEFSKKYQSKGLVVIGISLDDGGWKTVQPALAKLNITYLVVLGDSKVSNRYGMGDLLPVTFLIDRTGKIQAVKEGFGKQEEFESTIERLLSPKP